MGMGYLEAMSAGIPVVITENGALKDPMLPGVTTFVVPRDDMDSTADRVPKLFMDDELARYFGRQGRWHVEQTIDVAKNASDLLLEYRPEPGRLHS